jgi:hypothetical protein
MNRLPRIFAERWNRLILILQSFYISCHSLFVRSSLFKWAIQIVLSASVIVTVWTLIHQKVVLESFVFGANIVGDSGDPAQFQTLSTLFITAGASIVGVIAIAFSLSLFFLQQAADKHTPRILNEFLRDRVIRNIYWELVFIALLLFFFPYLFPRTHAIHATALMILFFLRAFDLLRKQYSHTAQMIDPRFIMGLEHNRAIESLKKIDHRLNRLIKAGVIRPGSSQRQAP